MATIALRANNPAGLTNAQLDANFTNLNNDKVETSYLANTFPGSTNITTLGTITAGTWQGSVINSTYGGTGVNNGGRTITLNTGNLTLTAQSGGSSVTVPASGTLYASGQTDVALGDGGTGASLSAVNGGVVYSTASAMAISAAGTAGQLLVSAGAAAPAFASFDFATHAPDSSFKKVVRVATTSDLGASTFSSNVLTGYSNTTGAISAVSTAGSTTVTFSTGDLAKIKAGATISTPSVYIPAGLTLTPATTTTATLSSATRSLTTTAASGTGTTATLTFASQTYAPYAVGATIVVAGVTPTAYNGTFTVTACTTTTVSYSSTATGTQTVAGTVTQTVGAGTANITATQSIAALSIDGVTMAVGDRVLVKDQRTLGGLTVTDAAKYNGIYSVTAIGSSSAAWTLTRTADADSASDLDSALVNVSVGTSNYGKTYKTRFSGTSTLNTTEMWWGRLADVNSSGYINTPTTAVGIDIATDTETILLKSGAVTDLASNSIGIKTITSTAASTYTRASSLYIAGAPVASTNATITTSYALYVAGGSTYLGGAVTTGSTINGLTLASTSISAAGGLTVSAAGTLSLSTSTTNAISIDTGTTGAISIGTNANAKNITIGNTTAGTEINLLAGAAALDASVGVVVNSNTSIVGTATAGTWASQDTVIGTPFYSTVTVTSGASSYAPAVKVRMVGGTRTRFHSIGAVHNTDNTVDTVIHAMDNGDANNYVWVFSNTGNFTSPGNVTANSDARLKSNVETIPNALEKTKQLRGVTFIKDGMTGMGVIAQEVKEVIPEVVIESKDEDKTLSVAYGNMVGLLIEAIKEQQKQIDDLKSQIASLK